MVSIRTCQCGCPAVTGPWCWQCAHELTPKESTLGFIPWGSDDFGPDPSTAGAA